LTCTVEEKLRPAVSKRNTMKPRLNSSPAARDLIKRFTPFHESALRGPDGRWVVGYGHHAAARQGVTLSRDEASLLLIHDAMQAETAIKEICGIALNLNQLDALVCFVHGVESTAFRRSDVARYLFEGRAQAAGEAIATHGDFDTERREAESALFLTAMGVTDESQALAKQNASTVEVVIQVEHATASSPTPPSTESDQVVSSVETADLPATPQLPVPPPPMPLVSAGKLQAENEIARILAAAQAIPHSSDASETDVSQGATGDFDDGDSASLDTDTERAEKPKIPGSAAPKKRQVVTAPLDSLLASRARFVPQPVTRDPENSDASTPPQSLEGPDEGMPTPIVDEDGGAASATEPSNSASASETNTENDPVPPELDVVDEAMASFTPDADPGAELDNDAVPAAETAPSVSPTDQLIARMAQQISDVPVVVEDPSVGSSENEFADRELPDGVAVGYVLAGGMIPAISSEPGTDPISQVDGETAQFEAAAPDAQADAASSDVGVEIAELAAAMVDNDQPNEEVEQSQSVETTAPAEQGSEVSSDIQTDDSDTTDPVLPGALDTADIIESDGAPPPHPAQAPASTEGSVGDVIATDEPEIVDEFGEAAEASRSGADLEETDNTSLDDEFSPQDLTGGAEPYVDQNIKSDDQSGTGMGFVLVFVAGAFLAAFGVWDASEQWAAIWSSKNLTMGAYMALGGLFLMIVSGWMFVSDFLAHRKQSVKD
jgi:GH24 family phage-related lysozyme (muramidase)